MMPKPAALAEMTPLEIVIVELSTFTQPDCEAEAVVHEIVPELTEIVDPSVCTIPCAPDVATGKRAAATVPLLISDPAMLLFVSVCVSLVPTMEPDAGKVSVVPLIEKVFVKFAVPE